MAHPGAKGQGRLLAGYLRVEEGLATFCQCLLGYLRPELLVSIHFLQPPVLILQFIHVLHHRSILPPPNFARHLERGATRTMFHGKGLESGLPPACCKIASPAFWGRWICWHLPPHDVHYKGSAH